MNLKFSLASLFGGRAAVANNTIPNPKAVLAAPGTQLHYNAGLIPRFLGHHGVLVDLISKVRSSAIAGDYVHNAKYIRKFKLMLNEHLLEENLLLYTYLGHCLKDDTEGNELMQEMRKEMGTIGRAVTQFIRHYEEFGVDARNVNKFTEELDGITSALGDRIAREERSLYTLYMPPADIN
ncbi:MAG: hemerythrin domain-containing protein [Rhodanobacter sp.]